MEALIAASSPIIDRWTPRYNLLRVSSANQRFIWLFHEGVDVVS